ncbi:hypothetical protein ABBQ38_004368 [Trebouxia sp. C0009 RCD-2024]
MWYHRSLVCSNTQDSPTPWRGNLRPVSNGNWQYLAAGPGLSVGSLRTAVTRTKVHLCCHCRGIEQGVLPEFTVKYLKDMNTASLPQEHLTTSSLGPISASPQYVAEALVDFASLTSRDTLFDLGCNDGRVVITAARLAAVKGVGIELDITAASKAQQAVLNEQLQESVRIVCGDIFQNSLSGATVVFMYLLPKGIVRLLHKLQTELQPGCRVITYMFRIHAWEAHHVKSQGVSSKKASRMDVSAVSMLHLYNVPALELANRSPK